MHLLDYSRVASLETYRAHYGSFTVVRLVNQHGAITWLKLYDGKLYNLPHWMKSAKLETDYQSRQ